jgi:prolipoprotein diacylglyceryltransferase
MLGVISYPPIPIWDLGPLRLSLHGVFAGIGFIAGAALATRQVRRRDLEAAAYQSALIWGLVGAILGARLLTAPAMILDGVPVLEALNPLAGNFSIMGGFAGGILAGTFRARALGLPLLPTLDASAYGLALGTVVGRLGDIAIVEHLGRATNVAWGYGVRPGYDLAPQHDLLQCGPGRVTAEGLCPVPGLGSLAEAVGAGSPGIYHHVAAYDLIGAAVLLGGLFLVDRRFRLAPGGLFFLWMAWYGLQRFLLDSLRFGAGDATLGPFTWNQVSGLTAGVAGALLMWRSSCADGRATSGPASPR